MLPGTGGGKEVKWGSEFPERERRDWITLVQEDEFLERRTREKERWEQPEGRRNTEEGRLLSP